MKNLKKLFKRKSNIRIKVDLDKTLKNLKDKK